MNVFVGLNSEYATKHLLAWANFSAPHRNILLSEFPEFASA
jgi:hypothetical protein